MTKGKQNSLRIQSASKELNCAKITLPEIDNSLTLFSFFCHVLDHALLEGGVPFVMSQGELVAQQSAVKTPLAWNLIHPPCFISIGTCGSTSNFFSSRRL